MKMTTMSLVVVLAVTSFITILSSSQQQFVDAQAQPLTPKSSGSTSTITAYIMSQNQFLNGDQRYAIYIPAYYKNTDIAAETASNLCLVFDNTQSPLPGIYSIIYNFTSTESTTIRTWLGNLPKVRNNIHVTFTATWDASGRFGVDPVADKWQLTHPSLLPYAINASCNVTAQWERHAAGTRNLPASCENVLLPISKSNAAVQPACTLFTGQVLMFLYTLCFAEVDGQTQRSLLQFFYCNDPTEKGVTLLCDYAWKWKASGDAEHAPVSHTGADGFPVAGRADQEGGGGGASAGNLSSTTSVVMMTFIIIILSFIMMVL